MRKIGGISVALFVLLALPSLSQAQLRPLERVALRALREGEAARVERALEDFHRERDAFGLGLEDELRPSASHTDRFGFTHVHADQYHRGLPVFGATAILHVDPSGLMLPPTSEGLHAGIALPLDAIFSASDAATIAIAELEAKSGVGLATTVREVIHPIVRQVSRRSGKPLPRPNAIDFERRVEDFRHAWHVHLTLENAIDGTIHRDSLIDARTGEILLQWDSLQTAAATGTGLSQYSGTVALDTWQGASQFELRDVTRATGDGNATFDARFAHEDDFAAPTYLFTDADNHWGDGQDFAGGSTTSANGQTAAVDAHYGLQVSWDYLQTIHDRFGIDGLGTPTYNRVHVGMLYDNAYWYDGCFCMSYGDGSYALTGWGFTSMAALDVAAHELGHGLTSQTAGLIYIGESGGLNEASSDILGTMVEFWHGSGMGAGIGDVGGDWTLGEDLAASPMRWLFKPSLDGWSVDAWYPGIGLIDVHHSSGPLNRAFFFLSEGALAASTGSVYSSSYLPAGMTGIGKDAAAAIWYRALTVYLHASANYVSARTAFLRAAEDLHGRDSAEFRAVQDAFAAINVGHSAVTFDDLQAPTLTLTVTGTQPSIQLDVVAADNVGVEKVEFFVDGQLFGSRSTLPHRLELDTRDLPSGAHQVWAIASDFAGNRGFSSLFPLVVSNPADQILVNPGFELGTHGWFGDLHAIVFSNSLAFRGVGFTALRGWGYAGSHSIAQLVSLPSWASRATLSFWVGVRSDETSAQPDDTLLVVLWDESGNYLTTLHTISNLDPREEWMQVSVDLSAYVGQTLMLGLYATEDDGEATTFAVDELALRVADGPDTTPPTVTARASVRGDDLILVADTWDDGRIASVEFIVDGVSKGTAAPMLALRLPASDFTSGLHQLEVRAVDAAGNVGQSPPTAFAIDHARTELIQNGGFEQTDAAGQALWPMTTNLPGGATFYTDASYAHTGDGFFVFWNYPGSHQTTLQQLVAIPASSTSAILRLWARQYLDSASPGSVAIEVRDPSGNVLETLLTLQSADREWYELAFDLSAYAGQTIGIALRGDLVGATGNDQFHFDDVSLTVTPTPDVSPPIVTASVESAGSNFVLVAEARDDVWVSSLQFFVDGVPLQTIDDPEGEQRLAHPAASLSPGVHDFSAVAQDIAGNAAEVVVSFGTPAAPPSDTQLPVITLATDGILDTLAAVATATDDTGVTLVEFYLGDQLVDRRLQPPFRLEVAALNLPAGLHTLRAVAWDGYGKRGAAEILLDYRQLLLSPSTATVAVGESIDFLITPADPAPPLHFFVVEGPSCGVVDSAGLYAAPAQRALCTVGARTDFVSTSSTVAIYDADLDGDGRVDGTDMALLAASWGSDAASPAFLPPADFDFDSAIGDAEITLFLSQFGRQP